MKTGYRKRRAKKPKEKTFKVFLRESDLNTLKQVFLDNPGSEKLNSLKSYLISQNKNLSSYLNESSNNSTNLLEEILLDPATILLSSIDFPYFSSESSENQSEGSKKQVEEKVNITATFVDKSNRKEKNTDNLKTENVSDMSQVYDLLNQLRMNPDSVLVLEPIPLEMRVVIHCVAQILGLSHSSFGPETSRGMEIYAKKPIKKITFIMLKRIEEIIENYDRVRRKSEKSDLDCVVQSLSEYKLPLGPPIPKTNVGHQLLQTLGWEPGTLIGNESSNSLSEPVTAAKSLSKKGLGCSSADGSKRKSAKKRR